MSNTPDFNFDEIIPRRGSGSLKWDCRPCADAPADYLPMWVADMDFKAAPAILEAVKKRAEHGIFGYAVAPDAYYEAIISWFERRHDWTIRREEILYTTAVIPAISCALQALTLPGEEVLVLTPVYNNFFTSIQNCGCIALECPMVYEDRMYSVDWEAFEKCCSRPGVSVFLLCNPHNPGGKIWKREELERLRDICRRHGVRVVSDEIHCEIAMPGYKYTPYAKICKDAGMDYIILGSPTKSFNIAGLKIANIVCSNERERRKIERALHISEAADLNSFSADALIAAYNHGAGWLDAMCLYIKGNYDALCAFLEKEMPRFQAAKLEGTYLAWLDIRPSGLTCDEAADGLLKEQKLLVSRGTIYGAAGEGFLRINLALPRTLLMEGLRKLAAFFAK